MAEHGVTGAVTPAIVYLFEMIDVDQQQRKVLAAVHAFPGQTVDRAVERFAIGEAGQAIEAGVPKRTGEVVFQRLDRGGGFSGLVTQQPDAPRQLAALPDHFFDQIPDALDLIPQIRRRGKPGGGSDHLLQRVLKLQRAFAEGALFLFGIQVGLLQIPESLFVEGRIIEDENVDGSPQAGVLPGMVLIPKRVIVGRGRDFIALQGRKNGVRDRTALFGICSSGFYRHRRSPTRFPVMRFAGSELSPGFLSTEPPQNFTANTEVFT